MRPPIPGRTLHGVSPNLADLPSFCRESLFARWCTEEKTDYNLYFPEHIHLAMAPLIFREKVVKQTEPLLFAAFFYNFSATEVNHENNTT